MPTASAHDKCLTPACTQRTDGNTLTGGSGDGGGGGGGRGKSATLAKAKATVTLDEATPSKCGQWLLRELRELEKDRRKYEQEACGVGPAGGVNNCCTHKRKNIIPTMKRFPLIKRE